jgi:hypothetical protein
MARKSTWGSWAPAKTAWLVSHEPVAGQFAHVYLPWPVIERGWSAFAEVEAQRVARRWARVDVLVWTAAYGGAFLTLRRVDG